MINLNDYIENLSIFSEGSYFEKRFGQHTFANGLVTDTFVRMDKRGREDKEYYNRYHLTITKNPKTKAVIFRTHYFSTTEVDKEGATVKFSEPKFCDGLGIEFSQKIVKDIINFIQQ